MTSNEYALDVLTFSESQSNQNSKPLFKRTTLTKSDDPNQEIPSETLQTIPHAQVEEVLTYSNFPFSNKSQLSIQGTQEDLDKLFALNQSNVPKTIQVYGSSQISQGSLNLTKDPHTFPTDGENVYGRNNKGQGNGRKSYNHSLDISNIEEKSGIIVESFGDKISPDASDMKILLSSNKDTPGPASPIRYGKMSEEAAAMAYEARRKELLDSLAKVTDKKPKKSSTPNNNSRKNAASTDARRSPDQKSPIGNKTFTNFEQKIGSVRKAALSKDSNVPPSPHFGRAGPEGSKPKARTREDVAHLIAWTPKSTQQSNRRSNSKNSNRSFSNLSSSFRDPEERAAVLNKLLAKDHSAPTLKDKRLNNAQQAALKGFTFGKDNSGGKDLYMKLTTGNEESTVAEEQQRESSPKPIPQQNHSVEVESQEIEEFDANEGDEEQEEQERERERERNVFAGSTYQSVYFSSRMKSQGKDVMEDLDALDKEISKMETENKEEEARNSVQKRPVQSKVRPQSASLNKNKGSLTNSPIKISDNGAEVQSVGNAKRLTPIKEVRNTNVRGQRTASKESEKTAPTEEQEEVVQYETLNERGYQGHYEYLHARAMVQKKNKDIIHKKNQMKKAAEETEECTFTPKTISSPSRREDIISKTKKWEAEREDKLVRNEMAIIEKEMSACTFYPNNMLQTASPGSHTFSNFFQRNTEWRKNKETKNKIREEKVYGSMMTSPKALNTRETFVTLSNSKDEITPNNYTLPTRSTYLGSPNNNNKPLKTCCEEKLTTLSTFKKDGQKPSVAIEGISSPSRRPQSGKQKPATSTAKKTMTSPKKKEVDGSELKHDIAQSYKLLQQLKDTVKDTTAAKNKFTKKPLNKQQLQTLQTQPSQQQHEVNGYDDFDFRLKTSGASFLRDNDGFTEHSQRAISRNSQKFSIESSPQPRLSAPRKVPLSSVEFDPSIFQPGEYMITQQNNRYYIQDKRNKKEKNSSASKVLRTSSSEQNLHSGSPLHGRPSAQSPNHSILSNRNSYRDSSAKKNKNVTINTDLNLEYYDNGGSTEVRKGTNTSVNGKKNSDFLKLHYVTNGIVELPQTASLDKKYSELINKVHHVSGQIKTLGKGVYMSQI